MYDQSEKERVGERGQHVDAHMTQVFGIVFRDWMMYDLSRIVNRNFKQ